MAETIEYCLRNVDGPTRSRLRAVDACASDAAAPTDATDPDSADSDPDVVEQRCLQRCGTCYSEAFLVVDGAVSTGKSHAALLAEHLPGESR